MGPTGLKKVLINGGWCYKGERISGWGFPVQDFLFQFRWLGFIRMGSEIL